MNESFLHYIWQFQYFDKSELQTSEGETLLISDPGFRNSHGGPDFHNARVRIGPIAWVGCVEIHIHSSGWRAHRHDHDPAYENVVLHVVWEENEKVMRKDGTCLPTLRLRERVAAGVLLQYKRIFQSRQKIPCAGAIHRVSDLVKTSMLDKVLMSRLETKAGHIRAALEKSHADWQETCYQVLCRNFGFKVNSDPFLQLAQALPYKTIMKHGDRLEQIEALLFGQAGFLQETVHDDYYLLLKREYTVLARKFALADSRMRKAHWRFLRLRPANFPTIRIAQLAALLHRERDLFSRIVSLDSDADAARTFSVPPSPYWLYHYRFFKRQRKEIPPLGKPSLDNLVINSIVPMLVAYGKAKDDAQYIDRALRFLQRITSEENNIVRSWKQLGMVSRNAFDSQALIELYNNFCTRRRCLDCNIGFSLLQPARR